MPGIIRNSGAIAEIASNVQHAASGTQDIAAKIGGVTQAVPCGPPDDAAAWTDDAPDAIVRARVGVNRRLAPLSCCVIPAGGVCPAKE